MPKASPLLLPPGLTVLERGWLSSNNVVITGEGEAAVVDTGYWTHAEQTVALVAQAVDACALTVIASTHLHSDHCGGNAALQAAWPQARTLVPPGQAAAVREWNEDMLTYAATGQHCPRFSVDGVLQPGSEVVLADQTWQVHAAPGHDPHSVVLFEPVRRTLISADALWENGFGVVFQELEGEDAFDEVGATLDVIERLAPALVIPGHGGVFTDVAAALGRARSRLDAYRARPDRHATHAAKVLMKFKLLEVQRTNFGQFLSWVEATPYFTTVHRHWFRQTPLEEWISGLVADLERSGVAARQGNDLVNT
jgi:glyoxylase-like metal-dependent hydrolase (beta-lactamase superfamily II)